MLFPLQTINSPQLNLTGNLIIAPEKKLLNFNPRFNVFRVDHRFYTRQRSCVFVRIGIRVFIVVQSFHDFLINTFRTRNRRIVELETNN